MTGISEWTTTSPVKVTIFSFGPSVCLRVGQIGRRIPTLSASQASSSLAGITYSDMQMVIFLFKLRPMYQGPMNDLHCSFSNRHQHQV